MNNKKKYLAIDGGKKTITFNSPHWKWPPNSTSKINSVKNYYKYGEQKKQEATQKLLKFLKRILLNIKKKICIKH